MLHLRLTSTRGKREGTLQTNQAGLPLTKHSNLVWQQANANVSIQGLGLCEFGVKLTTEDGGGNKCGRGGEGWGRAGWWWAGVDGK